MIALSAQGFSLMTRLDCIAKATKDECLCDAGHVSDVTTTSRTPDLLPSLPSK